MSLLALFLFRCLLGDAAQEHAVKCALALQLLAVVVRWGTLSYLVPRGSRVVPPRAWHAPAVTATVLSLSFGVANILLSARDLSSAQLLEAAVIITAVCGIGQRSMVPHLVTYSIFVAVQLGTLILLVLRSPDPALVPVVPLTLVITVLSLVVSAVRNTADVRERIRLSIDLHESSVRDALTGLRNRRFATAFAEQRAAQRLASRSPERRMAMRTPELAFLIVDLDHFKAVNDRHGHAGGDRVLTAFAEIATKTLRAHDVIARWGGEEFLVILEVMQEEDAKTAAERLRRALAEAKIEVAPGVAIEVTCSIGGATFTDSWQKAIQGADAALYRAKATGRNRVSWDDEVLAPAATLKLRAVS